MKLSTIKPLFVEFIPRELDEGIIYISEPYRTASHKCACGCGEKVVTPLSPADWQLRKDGGLVSLHPSIGNWNYPCRSHYWIRRNRIHWGTPFSSREIARVQRRDLADKAKYIEQLNQKKEFEAFQHGKAEHAEREEIPLNLWNQLPEWMRRLFGV